MSKLNYVSNVVSRARLVHFHSCSRCKVIFKCWLAERCGVSARVCPECDKLRHVGIQTDLFNS